MLKFVEALSRLSGPSGWEDAVRAFLRAQAEPYADELYTDKLGNVHVLKKGRVSTRRPVILAAYMDEPGFMVKDITCEGMVKFGLMTDTDVRTILGKCVWLGEKKLRGVVGRKPIHLTTAEERKTVPEAGELYIDFGATDHAMAIIRVSKGDCGCFDGPFRSLGENKILSKAMGRSLTCGALLELMKKELPVDTWFVFTTGGLVGSRGAYAAAEGHKNAQVVTLDICPGEDSGETQPLLGKGLVIPAMDRGTIYEENLRNRLRKAAETENIPVQPWAEIPVTGQAGVFREKGATVAALDCPVKFYAAPCQMADRRDAAGIVPLLMGYLKELEGSGDGN